MFLVPSRMGAHFGINPSPFSCDGWLSFSSHWSLSLIHSTQDMGILTVGVVTYPFSFEGRRRALQVRAAPPVGPKGGKKWGQKGGRAGSLWEQRRLGSKGDRTRATTSQLRGHNLCRARALSLSVRS